MNVLIKYKRLLTIVNVIILCAAISSYHMGFFSHVPFWAFLIFCIVAFSVTIYRPGIMLAILVGVLPLEIISIAPDVIDFSLRPYQIITVMIFFGLIGAAVVQVDIHKRFSWNIFDTLIATFLFIGFASASIINAQNVWIQTLIFFSFGLLYFEIRFFIREKKEVIALFPILISSGVVIGVYAIMQNILFSTKNVHLEVMPGRPNATFAEPDWLGMYLVFVFAVCLACLYYNAFHKHLWKFFDITLYVSTFLIFTATVLTVARSAWLGVVGVMGVYFLVLIFQKKYKLFARHFAWSVSVCLLSAGMVVFCDLTTFELGNRAQSTGTGKQEITVSCVSDMSRDTLFDIGYVGHIEELEQYNCRHIDLEEIQSEESIGHYVVKIYRDDPNVSVRSGVYGVVVAEILEKPLLGYGWGSGGEILGTDEMGTPLNASNIFLETALAIGLAGTGVLFAFFVLIFFFGIKVLRTSSGSVNNSIAIFALLSAVAILVPNMFNAGLFLGFVWVYFGLVAILHKML